MAHFHGLCHGNCDLRYIRGILELRKVDFRGLKDQFDVKKHDILAELDDLLAYCRKNQVSEETISDINIKTLGYIKKCKKLKSSRNIQMTKRYLKDNNLLAVPFDKGVGICLMKKEDYCSKLNDILRLPQFQKVEKGRKNEKNPLLKEEERIVETLKTLRDDGKIEKSLYKKLKP